MKRTFRLCLGFWVGCILTSASADDKVLTKDEPDAGIKEMDVARKKGLDWLTQNQAADGSWGKTYTLAVTSFACLSYLGNNDEPYSGDHGKALTKGLTFLTPNLFRGAIEVPAEAPVGTYDVDVKLFADGAMIARTNSAFDIVKVGFERFIANSAADHGLFYGLATAAMAIMTGWFASVVFRKD